MGCSRPAWMYHQKRLEIDASPKASTDVEIIREALGTNGPEWVMTPRSGQDGRTSVTGGEPEADGGEAGVRTSSTASCRRRQAAHHHNA